MKITILSTTEYRANHTKYFGLVDRGEQVILRSRQGSYYLTPATDQDEEEAKRDVTAEVCQALKDRKEYLDTFHPPAGAYSKKPFYCVTKFIYLKMLCLSGF